MSRAERPLADGTVNDLALRWRWVGVLFVQADYAVTLEMHGEIDVCCSKRLINPNKLFFTLVKKESGPYWPRLLKEKTKQHWLKVRSKKHSTRCTILLH